MLTSLDLFSGIGGFAIACKRQGIITKQFVEIEGFCQQVLNKNFPGIDIHSDICDFHANPGQFDIITGGFPCQDLSVSNSNGEGLNGSKSGLWFEYLRLINEIKPKGIVIENVPPTENRNWIETVLEGLDESGYDAIWQTFKASDFGYLHQRKRLYIVAYTNSNRSQKNVIKTRYFDKSFQKRFRAKRTNFTCSSVGLLLKKLSISGILRMDDGFSKELDRDKFNQHRQRIKTLGNALIPEIAEFNLYCLKDILEQLKLC